MDNEFCLISSIVSPPPPPLAAIGLFVAKELKTKSAVEELFKPGFRNLTDVESILFKVFASILEVTPPPVKYLIVKIVFEGATP